MLKSESNEDRIYVDLCFSINVPVTRILNFSEYSKVDHFSKAWLVILKTFYFIAPVAPSYTQSKIYPPLPTHIYKKGRQWWKYTIRLALFGRYLQNYIFMIHCKK